MTLNRAIGITLIFALAIVAASTFTVVNAEAGSPTKFSNRAAFEKAAAGHFQRVMLNPPGGMQPLRLTVTSIGCAKLSTGRALCALGTYGRDTGPLSWTVRISCPDDRGINCRYRVRQA